ncbi:hypothetical protein GCM10009601_27290 [Streptomyces thermospinosisporus]|uniref:GNAT family N-acetyltransferase n=1 Tax=Streptomyces thermospinosisporus TaxID=161482 RepID=A0ABN1YVK0_9ACTN
MRAGESPVPGWFRGVYPAAVTTTTTAPRLEEITAENLDAALGIRVRPEQEFAVAPVVKSLAEAYVHPGVARPRLIMDGERAVGFLMASSASTGSRTAAASARACGG